MKKSVVTLLLMAAMLIVCVSAQTRCQSIDVNLLAREQRVLIDVSRHQGDIDWRELAKSQVKWVYIKATEGSSHTDTRFNDNVRQAREAGLKLGVYHFLTERSPVKQQANHFLETVRGLDMDLIPMLDVEINKDWSSLQLVDSVNLFINLVEQELNCKVIIYTSESFFNCHLAKSLSNHPLWIAKYSNFDKIPDIGCDYYLWQCSDRGVIRGVDGFVCVSVFTNGHRPRDMKIHLKKKDKNKDKKKGKN